VRVTALVLILVVAALPHMHARQVRGAAAAPSGMTMVVETGKGTVEIELNSAGAPKTVEHIVGLVKANFYRGLRVHRVESSLAQFGDPNTRDFNLRDAWGRGNSGHPIGVNEARPAMKFVRGSVGIAYNDDPRYGDSQLFIMKAASPALDGKFVLVGRVTRGIDVVDKLVVTDLIRTITLK